MICTTNEQLEMNFTCDSCWNPETHKYSKEWRREHGMIFGVSYLHGRPDVGMTFEIYDKSGNVRSRLKLDEKMMRDLKQDIDICLGLIKEEED